MKCHRVSYRAFVSIACGKPGFGWSIFSVHVIWVSLGFNCDSVHMIPKYQQCNWIIALKKNIFSTVTDTRWKQKKIVQKHFCPVTKTLLNTDRSEGVGSFSVTVVYIKYVCINIVVLFFKRNRACCYWKTTCFWMVTFARVSLCLQQHYFPKTTFPCSLCFIVYIKNPRFY